MFNKISRFAKIGIVKKSTNNIVDSAVEKQKMWVQSKKDLVKKSVKPVKKSVVARTKIMKIATEKLERRVKARWVIKTYWFPILCILAVVAMIIYVSFIQTCPIKDVKPNITAPIAVPEQTDVPTFDIVRISRTGQITIAGRFLPQKTISIEVNKKIIATELTDGHGQFLYISGKDFEPGNYTLRLLSADSNAKSIEDVFVYVAPKDTGDSLSLLITQEGSRLLQSPSISREDMKLMVSKIDYLANGRIVVQGKALPRLRVTLALDGKELGFARVSDYKNFGLGANVEKLNPGQEYKLSVCLHDGEGKVVARFNHRFVMPNITPGDETYYTVRRGDALWIIARNFMGRGILFSMIVDANKIENPDLIFPKQQLKIPVKRI